MQYPKLPSFLTAYDIERVLGVTYSEAKKMLELNELSVVIIGKTQRVLREDFILWVRKNPEYYLGFHKMGNKRVTHARKLH
ncbi:hypothetical protein ACQCT5_10575 [Sutcliffiella halmapala]